MLALRSSRKHRILGVVVSLGFLGAVATPRAGLEVHRHAGGEHAHVHPSHDFGGTNDGHHHEHREPAHHAAELALTARGGADHDHHHRSDREQTDQRTSLVASHEAAHLHAFAPFTRSLTSELARLAVVLVALFFVARLAVAAPCARLVAAQARGPPRLLPS